MVRCFRAQGIPGPVASARVTPCLLSDWLSSDAGIAELKVHVDNAAIAAQLPPIERDEWLAKCDAVIAARKRLEKQRRVLSSGV